jgi:hypothetical protein
LLFEILIFIIFIYTTSVDVIEVLVGNINLGNSKIVCAACIELHEFARFAPQVFPALV